VQPDRQLGPPGSLERPRLEKGMCQCRADGAQVSGQAVGTHQVHLKDKRVAQDGRTFSIKPGRPLSIALEQRMPAAPSWTASSISESARCSDSRRTPGAA
jgi:hypothetical protein